VSDQVMMEIRWNGRREQQRSYLTELLDLVHWTGRRIGAVRQLTFDDLRLGQGPHGCIRWPADTDKQGRETLVPISAPARAALDRIAAERPGIGPVPLFPSAHDPTKPMRYEVTRAWLLEAERLAKVETQQGSSWHAYRRGWATSRKRLPDVDVAAAGGWKSLDALKQCYQMADSATMQAVVDSTDELREAK
jgi:integrase